MVGNLQEWVADWVPKSPSLCSNTWGAFSDDLQCLVGGAGTTGLPGALIRGGSFFSGDVAAGVFYITAGGSPSEGTGGTWGFRCAR